MAFDKLLDLTEILKHRWDPVILDLLTKRPMGYAELAHQVRDHSGEYIADGVLSRTLQRLIRDGLITQIETGNNHRAYRATPEAARKVAQMHELNAILANSDR